MTVIRRRYCNARAAMPPWCASRCPKKALAHDGRLSPRYCAADPVEGGKQAVAETYRNICAVGAKPLADHRQYEFRQSGKAAHHGAVCRRRAKASRKPAWRSIIRSSPAIAASITRPMAAPILPAPVIGGVGLIDDVTKAMTIAFKAEGEAIFAYRRKQGPYRPVALFARNSRQGRGRRRRMSISPPSAVMANLCAR